MFRQEQIQTHTTEDRDDMRQRKGEVKKKNKSRFLFGKMTLKGSTLLISVLNITLIHYW